MTTNKQASLSILETLRDLAHKPSEFVTVIRQLIVLWMAELVGPTEAAHLYVDGDSGSDDTGDGTQANPFATIAKALEFVPDILTADHFIHLAERAGAVAYEASGLARLRLTLNGSLIIAGGGVNVLYEGTTSAAATGHLVFTDSTQAWTVDELVGKTVRFLDGAGAGHYRTIIANTATTFTVSSTMFGSIPGSGSDFEIIEPTVRLDFGAEGIIGGATSPSWGMAYPALAVLATYRPRGHSVTYSNVIWDHAGDRLQILGSGIHLQGVEATATEILCSAQLVTGQRAFFGVLDFPAAAADDEEDFAVGWGGLFDAAFIFRQGCELHGFVARNILGYAGTRSHYGTIALVSGRATGADGSSSSPVSAMGCQTRLSTATGGTNYGQFIVRPLFGETPTCPTLVRVHPTGSLVLGHWAIIDTDGRAGMDALQVAGVAEVASATSGTEIEIRAATGQLAVWARNGGRFVFDKVDLSNVTVNGSNTAAVGAGATGAITTATTGAAGAFLTDGSFVQGTDGSLIARDPL